MFKYSHIGKYFIILFLTSTLINCSFPSGGLDVRACQSISTETACTQFIDDMNKNLQQINEDMILKNGLSEISEDSNLEALISQNTDFAFLGYDFIKDNPDLEKDLSSVYPIKKIFFMPMLLITGNKNITKWQQLAYKTIGIDRQKPILASAIDQVMNLMNVTLRATPLYANIEDFPALLDDKTIDGFFCFAVDCDMLVKKAQKMGDNIHILELPKLSTQYLEYVPFPIGEFLKSKQVNQSYINTYGIWEYLVTTQKINQNVVQHVSKALSQTLKDTHRFIMVEHY